VKLFYDRVYKNWAKGEKKASTANGEATYFHNYIFQVIGEKKIIDLVEEDFRSLRDYIIQEKNLSPRTVEQCFDIFKSVWKCATQKKLVNWNCPTRDVKLPRVENQRTRFFSYEEYFVLMAELKKRSIDVHDMAMFSIHTGARRGEIFDLAVSVVDVKNKSCILRDGKGKPRHAFLTDDVLEMVERRIKNKQQHERLFTNRAGDRYVDMPRTFARAVDALGFNDGVKDMRDKAVFHTCRHTFASWHVQNGTDLYEVCKLMGHSSIQVTERYAHLRPDGLKLAAERFNGILRRD
jgi:integrase